MRLIAVPVTEQQWEVLRREAWWIGNGTPKPPKELGEVAARLDEALRVAVRVNIAGEQVSDDVPLPGMERGDVGRQR